MNLFFPLFNNHLHRLRCDTLGRKKIWPAIVIKRINSVPSLLPSCCVVYFLSLILKPKIPPLNCGVIILQPVVVKIKYIKNDFSMCFVNCEIPWKYTDFEITCLFWNNMSTSIFTMYQILCKVSHIISYSTFTIV